MATITISATVGAATFSKTVNPTDADAGRLIAWAKAQYGAALTNQQAFDAMSAAIFAGLRNNVLCYEKAAAHVTADAGVSDITFT